MEQFEYMTKKLFIACTMQVDLIKSIYKKHQISIPVIWLERSLHNNPRQLNVRLQELIDQNQGYDEILFSYGLCGNAVIDLKSHNTKLVLPKYDDCICQQLQMEPGKRICVEKGCLYLTREWTLDKEGIVQQCEAIHKKYPDNPQSMIDSIYGSYHSLVVLDTGCYDVHKLDNYVEKVQKFIDNFLHF